MKTAILAFIFAAKLAAQPVTPEAVALSYNWREDAVRDCPTSPDSPRCWIDRVTGRPFFTNTNAGPTKVSAWLAQKEIGNFSEWLASLRNDDRARTLMYDSPGWTCTYFVIWELPCDESQLADDVQCWSIASGQSMGAGYKVWLAQRPIVSDFIYPRPTDGPPGFTTLNLPCVRAPKFETYPPELKLTLWEVR